MADNVELNLMSGGKTVATDDVTVTGQAGTGQVQFMKLVDGTANGVAPVAVDLGVKANALRVAPVSDLTDATYIGDIKFGENLPGGTIDTVTTITNDVSIDDGGNSITVDNATISVVGGGAEATAQRVTIANDSTGLLSVDDGGGALTVDGTVTANAGTNLNTSALATESGGNLDTIAGDTTSLDTKIIVNGGVEAGAVLVTIANDSTGLVTVDTAGTTGLEVVQGTAVDLKAEVIGNGTFVTQSSITSAAVIGPADPSIDSLAQVAINLTTGANQVLVASAANKQIWVYGVTFSVGDADGQSVSFQDEDDVAITGIMEFAQYGGLSANPSGNFSMPLWKLATDKDLEVDILGGDVDGWLTYSLVSV